MNLGRSVFGNLYTCKEGEIRNPRTDRCLKLNLSLGKTVEATYKTLAQNGKLPVSCPNGQEWDASLGKCTANRSKVAVIRTMVSMVSRSANANESSARALSKLIASHALSKAAAASNASNAARAYDSLVRDEYEARLSALTLHNEAGNLQRTTNKQGREIASARRQIQMLQQALIEEKDRCQKKIAALQNRLKNRGYRTN